MSKGSQDRITWKKSAVTGLRDAVLKEITQAPGLTTNELKLDFTYKRIASLETTDDNRDLLSCYFFIIEALKILKSLKTKKLSKVDKLADHARKILLSQRILPGKSKLSFLFSSINNLVGQIYLLSGQHWSSAWEQQQGVLYQENSNIGPSARGFQELSFANRALRLGYAKTAIQQYEKCLELAIKIEYKIGAWLGLCEACWLSGNLIQVKDHLRQAQKATDLDARSMLELDWFSALFEFFDTRNFFPVIRRVKFHGTHHDAGYIVEAMLWAHALGNEEYVRQTPKMRSIKRNPKLKSQHVGFLLKAASVIETLDDRDIRDDIKIRKIGALCSKLNRIERVSHELLILASIIQFLSKNPSAQFLELVTNRYQSLSLTLTSGQSNDALLVLKSLEQKIRNIA